MPGVRKTIGSLFITFGLLACVASYYWSWTAGAFFGLMGIILGLALVL